MCVCVCVQFNCIYPKRSSVTCVVDSQKCSNIYLKKKKKGDFKNRLAISFFLFLLLLLLMLRKLNG